MQIPFEAVNSKSKRLEKMKKLLKKYFILPTLVAAFGLIHMGSASAQTFKTLYDFQASASGNAPNPAADLTLSGRTLYGVGSFGGANGYGIVFGFNLDNSTFTNIYSFTTPNGNAPFTETNRDGMWPYSNLILLGNSLYGMTEQGGTADAGTLFKVNTDGTGFADLNNFFNFPAAQSAVLLSANLIFTNNMLFGTATFGGTYSYGTVFASGTNGTGFTLHTFTDGTDGAYPIAGLVSGTNFYGAAYLGGSAGTGTIFKVGTNGLGFTVLHSFSAATRSSPDNSDGARPSSLLLSGNTLYGQTAFGGSSANGTVFKLNTDGSGFTNLYSFSTTSGSGSLDGTNSDGDGATSGFVLSGNTLYGATFGGGQFGHGTIFSLNTNGTGFTVQYTFTAGGGLFFNVTNNDGAYPIGGLILSSNILYGTTSSGGTSSFGTIFSLTLPPPPQLTMSRSGANLILTWPTNASGFTLQSTTNLFPAVWGSNSPAPIIVNGQDTVTNPISGTQKFYRLSQ
jgi:uncharacterized repeat protein (TIGR03803 family)